MAKSFLSSEESNICASFINKRLYLANEKLPSLLKIILLEENESTLLRGFDLLTDLLCYAEYYDKEIDVFTNDTKLEQLKPKEEGKHLIQKIENCRNVVLLIVKKAVDILKKTSADVRQHSLRMSILNFLKCYQILKKTCLKPDNAGEVDLHDELKDFELGFDKSEHEELFNNEQTMINELKKL